MKSLAYNIFIEANIILLNVYFLTSSVCKLINYQIVLIITLCIIFVMLSSSFDGLIAQNGEELGCGERNDWDRKSVQTYKI